MIRENASSIEAQPRILGIDADGNIVVLTRWNGESINSENLSAGYALIRTLTQDDIDRENDFENCKQEYEYLWRENGKEEGTGQNLDEYIEDLIEQGKQDGYFIGHDNSYTNETYKAIENLTEKQREKFDDVVGVEYKDWETFECVGCGSYSSPSDFDTSNWKCIIDNELVKEVRNTLKHKEMLH